MALLELKDIGKIYVSEGTVAVGIRGVNLSFERGEFVAVTGKSGSGKSTLLNVISGMDSYEEGELFIEGEQTSHYTQADWERYREKYISFIFQEYNIIESFTVLENVELALMHITNPVERRSRAMELIKRVGLEQHVKHKGSHLSGGQKQRTVIARALAKDSPIILADEPTGNLDSVSSKEIIDLLKEVSRDKLLIVVTHNFEEVEAHATREIRVFDGSVASDTRFAADGELPAEHAEEAAEEVAEHKTVRNSMVLGLTVFKSKPKLSLFICVLLLVASALLFFSFAGYWKDIRELFADENYMFNDMPGRVVVVRNDGSVMGSEELERIAGETGAERSVRLDMAFDLNSLSEWKRQMGDYVYFDISDIANPTFGVDYGELDVGRYPEADDEVVISVPYFMGHSYGYDQIAPEKESFRLNLAMTCRIVGIHYYMDTNRQAEILMTEQGFKLASAFAWSGQAPRVEVDGQDAPVIFDNRLRVGKVKVIGKAFSGEKVTVGISGGFEKEFTGDDLTVEIDAEKKLFAVYVNPMSLFDKMTEYMEGEYRQASLFYSSKKDALKAIETLKTQGYLAVSADSTFKVQSFLEIIEVILVGILGLGMYILFIIFLAFFVRICTRKSMDAFKSDIAIMRSMGIRVREIKAAVYIRMFLCVIPAVILVPIGAQYLYRTEFGGSNLSYLYWPQYLMIYALLMVVVTRASRKHVANLFSENVRKALKGDEQ